MASRRRTVNTNIRDMIRKMVLDPKVLARLRRAAREDAQVALKLIEFGWGRPGPAVDNLNINVNLGVVQAVERMSDQELEQFVKTGRLTPEQWHNLPAPGSVTPT